MRTIKFRGKRFGDGEWVYGSFMPDYIHHKSGASIVEGGVIWHEVDPETVGQFVGLNDKDGTEIYEGDVVKCPQMQFYFGQYTYDVQYNENWCQFGITTGADWHNLSGDKDLYVIGNVHDNNELLK